MLLVLFTCTTDRVKYKSVQVSSEKPEHCLSSIAADTKLFNYVVSSQRDIKFICFRSPAGGERTLHIFLQLSQSNVFGCLRMWHYRSEQQRWTTSLWMLLLMFACMKQWEMPLGSMKMNWMLNMKRHQFHVSPNDWSLHKDQERMIK